MSAAAQTQCSDFGERLDAILLLPRERARVRGRRNEEQTGGLTLSGVSLRLRMLEIPIKPNSKHLVRISNEAIAFEDWRVHPSQVTAVAFMFSKVDSYLSSSGGYIHLHTPSKRYQIAARCFGAMGFFEGAHNMREVVSAIIKVVGERLLGEILSKVFQQNIPIQIGCLEFNADGIAKTGLLSSGTIPWTYRPYHTLGEKGTFYGQTFGATKVCYDDPSTGKQQHIGTVTSQDLNGFLVPHIIDVVRSR
jgi:hypothetical protein